MNSPHTTLNECFSLSADEIGLFACDITSQPHYAHWYETNAALHLKCSRALPIASNEDIVVLTGSLYAPYYEWLRSVHLGPAQVVSYDAQDARVPLADLIRANPNPVLRAIAKTNKKAVLIPFYCSTREYDLANLHGWELFGCKEDITLRYFDKAQFKSLCASLGINIIGGFNFERGEMPFPSDRHLERLLLALLDSYPALVVRGALGSAGRSVYQVDSQTVSQVVESLRQDAGSKFLIEPFLQIVASPNDQWCIRRDGTVAFVGSSIQLFSGLKHQGNLYGHYLAPRVTREMAKSSLTIVEHMARDGYRGIVGVDYVVSDHGVFPIENNSRLNGSTFAFGIVDRIYGARASGYCWKFYKAVVEPCNFSEFARKINSVIYDGIRKNSVFPFDCDAIETSGTLEVLLIAEDLYHVDHLERALEALGVSHA